MFPRHYQVNNGFTLIEVLVALGIVAVGMAAAFMTASTSVQNAVGLKERTFAHWVAMNKMAEIHIGNRKEWPDLRKTTGSSIMAGHEWYWTVEGKKPEGMQEDTIRKVEIQVRASENDEYPVTTLLGFVGKPSG